jgi:hypothetical protein
MRVSLMSLDAFSAYTDMMMRFLSLILSMCCITFIDLCMLYHPSIPGMKPVWSLCIIF